MSLVRFRSWAPSLPFPSRSAQPLNPPPLAAIEEPELGLHPDVIPHLAELLIRASARTQLVVTTHSRMLVDALSHQPSSVVVCSQEDGESRFARLDAKALKAWLDKYSLGDLWSMGGAGGEPVVSAGIYIEGGGEGQLLDTLFRQGWTAFFKVAGLEGRMPRIVRGQGRQRTYELFVTAVENPREGELPLLLVDSEGPVAQGHTEWEHLKARDDWDKPGGASDGQAFLIDGAVDGDLVSGRSRSAAPVLRFGAP